MSSKEDKNKKDKEKKELSKNREKDNKDKDSKQQKEAKVDKDKNDKEKDRKSKKQKREKSKDKKDKDREKDREKDKDKLKEYKEKDNKDIRDKEKILEKEKEKERQNGKDKDKDKDKDQDKLKNKEKDQEKIQEEGDKQQQQGREKEKIAQDNFQTKEIIKDSNDSESDIELKNVSLKYKQNRAALKLKQKDEELLSKAVSDEEIPIKKKEKEDTLEMQRRWAMSQAISQQPVLKTPENALIQSQLRQPGLSLQSSTANAMQQTLALGIYEKSQGGAYKIPQHLHKNYPHAIRLYIGNLPDNYEKEEFLRFFQKQMEMSNALLEPGQPPQLDKKYIFATFRSIEETTTAMNLDGIFYNGKVLRIRRVKDYDMLPKVEGERPIPQIQTQKLEQQKISTQVNDGPLKLFVSGLAPDIEEETLINLLIQYGALKSLHIVRDRITNQSKGYAFCEYSSEQDVVNCISQLNNKPFNGRTLQVKRGMPANLITADPNYKPTTQAHQIDTITIQEQQEWDQKLHMMKAMKISSVLRLTNMIKKKEIEEENELNFMKRDLKKELEKIGRVVNLIIPRIKDNHPDESVGRIYVEFENENYAIIAYLLLQGKKYDNKDIGIEFYDAHLFADQVY